MWLADGASLDGNEHTPLKTVLPPYSKEKLLDDWDWTGVNIRKESQGEAKEQDSLQAAVIARLKIGAYHLIFDDDGSGEAADVVAVTVAGPFDAPERIDVEFYHCTYSKKAKAAGRIDDLYVVCGQAQTSIRWMSSGENDRTFSRTCYAVRRSDRAAARPPESSAGIARCSRRSER